MYIAKLLTEKYPIYLYMNNKNLPEVENEIHINISLDSGGCKTAATCFTIHCATCPLNKLSDKGCLYCGKELLQQKFPELVTLYPELCI